MSDPALRQSHLLRDLRALHYPGGLGRGCVDRDVAPTRTTRYFSRPQPVPLPPVAQHHRHAEPMRLILLYRNNDAMQQYVRYSDADAHSDHACSLPQIFW
jgi:hypothetical protein